MYGAKTHCYTNATPLGGVDLFALFRGNAGKEKGKKSCTPTESVHTPPTAFFFFLSHDPSNHDVEREKIKGGKNIGL